MPGKSCLRTRPMRAMWRERSSRRAKTGCARGMPTAMVSPRGWGSLDDPLPQEFLDSLVDELRLFEGRYMRSAWDHQKLASRHGTGHRLREKSRRKGVLLASDHEHRHLDVGEHIAGAVPARGAQHAQEHRKIDVGNV